MNRSKLNLGVIACVVLVCIAVAGLSASWAEKKKQAASISITDPKDGNKIEGKMRMVTGKISDPKLRVYVLIHPMTTDRCWVQNIPSIDAKGTWRCVCYFGEDVRGVGEPFEVIAVALEAQGWHKNGDVLPYPLEDKNIVARTNIVVNRTK